MLLEETQQTGGKWKKERASLTDDEILRFYWICVGISRYCGTHLIPVTKKEIKEGAALLLIAETFAWHWRMDLPCLYKELKWSKASSQNESSASQRSYVKNSLLTTFCETFQSYFHVNELPIKYYPSFKTTMDWFLGWSLKRDWPTVPSFKTTLASFLGWSLKRDWGIDLLYPFLRPELLDF